MRPSSVASVLAAVIATATFLSSGGLAWAQAAPAAGAPPAAAAGGDGSGAVRTSTSSSTTVTSYPGGVAPLQPGQVLGGGNVTTSSSKPITGNEEDSFDLGPKSGGAASVRGGPGGPVFMGESGSPASVEPASGIHSVKKGDTLWDICDEYFQNPYQWPRIWSYNPQIQNPHWIEVGEQVRLRPDAGLRATAAEPTAGPLGGLQDARRRVPPRTVFLREEGFLENDTVEASGEITGSREDKMFLSDNDEVYLRLAPGHDAQLGEEFTVFRPVRTVPGKGKVIQIQGTLRVNEVDAKNHLARASIIESLDIIERGARVATIPRRFEVVPPVRNEKEADALVVASVQYHDFYGQYQVVFIDKGSDDGLVPGNRLLITRRGDAWRQSLPAADAGLRIDMENPSPAAVERTPLPRDESKFPEERVGELRVITTKKKSAMCVVIQSRREIEINEKAHLRRGY